MRASVIEYSVKVGRNPLLVQGAGGNASWKDGDTLWIKASGTWLADAAEKDIFVAVNLAQLKHDVHDRNFGAVPIVTGASALRPSIETMLHGLMPHPVVVHLHAVEILAHLVRVDFKDTFNAVLEPQLSWVTVAYHKPGAALAEAVSAALDIKPGANVVFLQNHGVVIGGNEVAEVDLILQTLVTSLACKPASTTVQVATLSPIYVNAVLTYVPITDDLIHQLALDRKFYDRLHSNWALCPDHVAFLGATPACYPDITVAAKAINEVEVVPEVIFVKGVGVFTKPEFNQANLSQLRCYYDLMARQPNKIILNVLSEDQIAELLNWDAEKYRIKLAK